MCENEFCISYDDQEYKHCIHAIEFPSIEKCECKIKYERFIKENLK